MTLSMHPYGPFALFAVFTFCGTVWVFFAFPECKGRSMEDADALFSLPWYKIGFAKVPPANTEVATLKEQEIDVDLEKQGSYSYEEKVEDEPVEGKAIGWK